MRGHFGSLDKDDSHIIRNAMSKTSYKLHGSMCYRTRVIANQSFTLWE